MATTSLSGLQTFVQDMGLGPLPPIGEADILHNPIDIYHLYLAEHFQGLVDCESHLTYKSIQSSKTIDEGDLDIVLPKLKLTGVNPKDFAGEVLKKFQPHALFAAPFKDGIHIRFFFSSKSLPRLILPYINDRKDLFGHFSSLASDARPVPSREKVIVEFSSPNIARDFTAGHLRSTVLGAFVANIYEAMGCSVVRVNYLGDWGKNFGLLGVGWQKYASEEPPDLFKYAHKLYAKMEKELEPEQQARKQARDSGEDPTLIESQGLFAERDSFVQRLEDRNVEAIALWEKLRAMSIDYYSEAYARLNLKFDEYSGESQVCTDSEAIAEVESVMKEKGIWEKQNEAWVIDFDKHESKLGTATLRDRNGSTTYLLRDIATVFDRLKNYAFDRMIYVVCEQEVHFRQVFKTVELMGRGDIAVKLQHIAFPRASISFLNETTGSFLGDILDQCENSLHDAVISKTGDEGRGAQAKAKGVNSMVIQELYLKKGYGSVLDLDLVKISEGETGTGLQMVYTRLCSSLMVEGRYPSSEELVQMDYAFIYEPPWSDVLRLLARFPEAVQVTFKSMESGALVSYLFRLAEDLTACLDSDEEEESSGQASAAGAKYGARGALYGAARQVMENGMRLLGAPPARK